MLRGKHQPFKDMQVDSALLLINGIDQLADLRILVAEITDLPDELQIGEVGLIEKEIHQLKIRSIFGLTHPEMTALIIEYSLPLILILLPCNLAVELSQRFCKKDTMAFLIVDNGHELIRPVREEVPDQQGNDNDYQQSV